MGVLALGGMMALLSEAPPNARSAIGSVSERSASQSARCRCCSIAARKKIGLALVRSGLRQS